jgi:hypothetical protein
MKVMKKVLALLIVVTLMAVGCAAYAADGGHGGSIVRPPDTAVPSNSIPDIVLKSLGGAGAVVAPLIPQASTVSQDVINTVQTYLNSYVARSDYNVEIKPVILPVLEAKVEFVAGVATVAFCFNKSYLSTTLGFGGGDIPIDQTLLFLLMNNDSGLLAEVEPESFSIEKLGDNVYFVFEISDNSPYLLDPPARRATTTVYIEPVVARRTAFNQPSSGGGGGGCDAGFSGVAALLALAGGVLFCRKSKG